MAKRRSKGTSRMAADSLREDKSKSKPQTMIEQPPLPVRQMLTPIKIFASDKLDSSQSDVCEVEWDSRSPITMTQAARYKNQSVDITELVKNYAEERENTSCSPPLIGLWRDHLSDTDDGTRGVKYRVQRLQRGRGKRNRGRPSGVKAAVSSKEMLLQLESVLETKPEEDDPEPPRPPDSTQRKSRRLAAQTSTEPRPSTSSSSTSPGEQSFDLFESAESIYTSTQKGLHGPLSLSGVLKAKNNITHSPILKVKSPLAEKIVPQSGMGNVTPKRPSDGLDRVRSPVPGRSLNQSLEDLWTDEDLFDDDSFIIKATQGAFDGVSTPRALKRKTPQGSPEVTTEGKSGRYTFTIGSASKEQKGQVQAGASSPTESGVPFKSYYSQNKLSKSPFRRMPAGSSQTKQFNFAKPRAARSPLAASSHNMTTRGSQPSAVSSNPSVVTSKPSVVALRPSTVTSKPSVVTSQSATVTSRSTVVSSKPSVVTSQSAAMTSLPNQKTTSVNTGPYRFTNTTKPQLAKHPNPNTKTGAAIQAHVPKTTMKPSTVQSSSTKTNPATSWKACDKIPPRQSFAQPRAPQVAAKARQAHSTPVRAAKPPLDMSLTDELLASLAEPDELLDSQMAGQTIELFDSQAFRDIQNEGPNPDPFTPAHNTGVTGLRDPPPVSRKETVPSVIPQEMAEDMFPDDDFDDFIADDKDEALSEPQLIAMLDIIESQASQEAKKDKTKPASSIAQVKPIVSEAKTNPNVAQSRPGPPPVRGQPSNSEQLKARGASSSDSQRGIPSVISKTNTQKTALHLSSTAKASTAASVSVTKPPVSTSHQMTGYARTTSVVAKTSSGSSESSSSSTSSLSSTKSNSQRLPASRGPINQSGSQTYTKEEIERKKQEALKRRQDRLKLSGKKT